VLPLQHSQNNLKLPIDNVILLCYNATVSKSNAAHTDGPKERKDGKQKEMTIYTDKAKANEALVKITAQQAKNNLFVNVSVKPYNGKKYPAGTVAIKIG